MIVLEYQGGTGRRQKILGHERIKCLFSSTLNNMFSSDIFGQNDVRVLHISYGKSHFILSHAISSLS